jgi:transposase
MTMDRIEVTTSVQRRRRWTAAEKGRLVAASLERGAAVSAIAREARIRPSQLYGWRPQLRSSLPATAGFAAVRVAGEGPATPGLSVAPGMIEIEFATGTQMSSAPERIRSNHIFNGSTRNGPQAFVTVRSCGGA